MRRSSMPLGDLATHVLDAVEREQLGKTAAATYTSNTTEVGDGLRKLAAELRSHNPDALTYDDLAKYRMRHGN
jgi:hypothetical protein